MQVRHDANFILAGGLVLSVILLSGCFLFPEGLPAPGAYKGGEISNPPPSPPSDGAGVPASPPAANANPANGSVNASGNESADAGANLTNASMTANLSNASLANATSLSNLTEGEIKIVFADVGFADATLIEAGNYTLLIDAGSNDSAYALGAILQASGVHDIDRLVISNWDDGKIGGLQSLTSQFTVHSVWHNGERPDSPLQTQMLRPLDLLDIPTQAVQAGDRFERGNLSIVVYNPQKTHYLGNMNNNAVALKVSYGKFCLFLPSDMEEEIDAQIVGQDGIGPCQAYKWRTHGKARPEPSILYERLQPQVAVISVGPNEQGLPSPTAIEWINLSNTSLYRTDTDGSVVVSAWLNGSYAINATKNMTTLAGWMQNGSD
ncbi:MAG: MBL fold metallo-hydrolase [Candidatus Micrarchaeota archaeon]